MRFLKNLRDIGVGTPFFRWNFYARKYAIQANYDCLSFTCNERVWFFYQVLVFAELILGTEAKFNGIFEESLILLDGD